MARTTGEQAGQGRTGTMQACADTCADCARICDQTLAYCLEQGGKHAEPQHIKLLVDCANMCRTCGTACDHGNTACAPLCQACADLCEACAKSCEDLGDDEQMRRCAEACRRCAEECKSTARNM